jgi:nucleoside-diphosphate-sugar epimerase
VSSSSDWDYCFDINVTKSIKLLQLAIKLGIHKIMICGTCSEYGLSGTKYDYIPTNAPLYPTGAYHASKAAATMAAIGLAVQYDLQLTVFRPFHIYGEGENSNRFWPSLMIAAKNGEDFPMTRGEQIRDFTPVEFCVTKISELMHDLPKNGTPKLVNIGTGEPQSLIEFAQFWWKKWQAQGKLLPGEVPYREDEVMRYVPNISIIK